MSDQSSILENPELMQKLENDIANGKEMNWLIAHFSGDTGARLDETPVVNFCNYRYKIVEIFCMTYRHEKAVLSTEIANPDLLLILGTFAEYKIMNRLQTINQAVSRGGHSWPKLLAMAKNDVRLLVNTGFVIMHLFAGDLVALSDNEIVYCYILAAAVVGSMNKDARNTLTKEIQKRGLKRHQRSISDRASQSSSFGMSSSKLLPKDTSGISETAYVKRYQDTLTGLPPVDESRRIQETPVQTFIAVAQRHSIRRQCLQSLSDVDKDLPQVGRLLHLGRKVDTEPKQLSHYIGDDLATPAKDLGNQGYKSSDTRSIYGKSSRQLW